jgi:hypothetical protein
MSDTRTRVLSHRELYLFDTQGFLLVPGLFSRDEVAELRRPFDTEPATIWQDFSHARRWNHVHQMNPAFRALAADPRLVDRAFDVINQPMRMLESYALGYDPGGSIFMHSGNVQDRTYPDGTRATIHMAFRSHYHDQRLYTNLVKTLVYLTDADMEEEGAFCFIHGSHKANYPFPWTQSGIASGRTLCETDFPSLGKLLLNAGDMLLLNEGLLHGATKTNKQRFLVSLLFGPAFLADFERISPQPGDLTTKGYYDADYEPSGLGFIAGCENHTFPGKHT